MGLTAKLLLQHCVMAVNNFQPEEQSLDIYINNYLDSQEIHEEEDETFITEVFCGIFRYPNVLSVVMEGYYAKVGQNVLRSEQSLYEVLCYLALFRLQELGVEQYKEFIACNNTNKMYKFLNFLFDEKNLITWMKSEWCKHYDRAFVQDVVLSTLLKELPALQKIVKTLRLSTENKIPLKKEETQPTDIKPFNLTQVKPRKVPIPEVIPAVALHKRTPATTYIQPLEFSNIANIKVQNRRKAEETLLIAAKEQIRCANAEKSAKVKQKISAIQAEQEAKCDFGKFKAKDIPKMIGSDVSFKLNTAAILREGQLYKAREQQTIKELNQLEAGYRDISKFLHWQTNARQKDYEESLAQIERNRYLGKLSYEEAILARQTVAECNRVKVQEMKQQAAEMMKEYLDNRLKEELTMRQLVEQTAAGHSNAKDAKKKLQQYKHKLVQEMNEETKEMMRQALEQAEEEMRKKVVLINEIRALESNPLTRHKLVDLTSTPGYGFLNEMSIVELKERLGLMRQRMKEEQEAKRDDIINDKTTKNQQLIEMLGVISKHRDEMARSAAKQLDEKRYNKMAASQKSEQAFEMERQLAEKRAKRKDMQAKNQVSKTKSSILRGNDIQEERLTMENSRWKELETRQRHIAKLTAQGIMGEVSSNNRLTLATMS